MQQPFGVIETLKWEWLLVLENLRHFGRFVQLGVERLIIIQKRKGAALLFAGGSVRRINENLPNLVEFQYCKAIRLFHYSFHRHRSPKR